MNKKQFFRAIDKSTFKQLSLYAAVAILLCAAIYRLLGLIGNGILSAYGETPSFANCVYYSVVTFTSLGYGDFYPKGWSKVVSGVEVITGLAFLGVLIAKLSSTRQNYYLGQLYARDAQQRLRDFYSDIKRLRLKYKEVLDDVNASGESVPLGPLHKDAEVLVMSIRNYVAYEISNGDFLGEVPKGPMTRILQTYSAIAPLLGQVAGTSDSLRSQKQRGIAIRVLGWMNEVAELVRENTPDPQLVSEARNATRITVDERDTLQTKFDLVALKFPNARMSRPIEWRLKNAARK